MTVVVCPPCWCLYIFFEKIFMILLRMVIRRGLLLGFAS